MKKTETIYAVHPIQSVLEQDPSRLLQVFSLQDNKNSRTQQLVQQLKSVGISVQSVNKKTIEQHANGASHQGIMAHVRPLPTLNEQDLDDILAQTKAPLLLILDGVTDPHNLGACLRNADAAGVAAVIVPKNKSASITPIVSKVACGAAATVPLIRVTNLSRTMKQLQEQNVWIVGTSGDATQSLYQSELTGPLAIVMGAEGDGMRRLTREQCDLLVSLPMAGQVSSLNVSVASGVCLFEAVRQRQS